MFVKHQRSHNSKSRCSEWASNIHLTFIKSLVSIMKRDKWKITSKKSALFLKIMSLEVWVIYMKMCTRKVFSYLSDVHILRLIIKLSFELTFWIWLDSKLSCSHFQLDLSWIEHIFNLMQLDSTRNQVNSTWLIKNSSLTLKELNIEIFPVFNFCIIFLHYLFALSFDRKS